jgi:alkylation response protein AidB-like acyl-CoA dehydrogenase
MDFSFSEEQQLLRDTLRSFLDRRYGFAARYAAARTESGWRPEIWQALARELGILGMPLPERSGGLGGDPVSAMVVMEEFGRALVIEPYLESVILCGGLLARAGGARADAVLAQMVRGEAVVALAWAEAQSGYDFARIETSARRDGRGWRLDGRKSVVMAAPWATQLLVSARTSGGAGDRAGVSLFILDKLTPGITVSAYPTVDGRRAADLLLDGVRLPADALLGGEGAALDSLEQAGDEAIAAISAEAVGVLEILLRDTVAYTQQRRQFGQPIANFQVLQHRMVDMYMEIEMARSATLLATLKLSAPSQERAIAASGARVTVSKACRFVGQNAVQLHGGMGMTDELSVGHYFKRATMIEAEFGSADFHLQRHAALTRATA